MAKMGRPPIHGGSHTREYNSWTAMRHRCLNSSNPDYEHYGGRGIGICAEWINSFENFSRDMGRRPLRTSLERKDNDKGYSPDNCYWATSTEQNSNRKFRLAEQHKIKLAETIRFEETNQCRERLSYGQFLTILHKMIETEGSLYALGKKLGINSIEIHHALKGKRSAVPQSLLDALGFEKEIIYIKKNV